MMWCEHLLLSVMFVASQWSFLQSLPQTPPLNHTSFNSSNTVSPHPTQFTKLQSPSSLDPSLPSTHTPQSTNPCIAKSLEAWRDERVSSQLAFQYKIEVEDPQQCQGPPRCDDGDKMMARPCKNSVQYWKQWIPQKNGSLEVCWGDCTKLSCGSIEKRPYMPQILELRGNVTLMNSTLMLVPLVEKPFPDFVKHLYVLVHSKGTLFASRIVKEQTSQLELPAVDEPYGEYSYRIQYKIISNCTGDWWTRLGDDTEKLRLPVPNESKMVKALSVTAVVLVLVVGVLATVLLIKHNQTLQLRPTQPWLGLHCSDGDILLIHGRDTPEVVDNSHALAQKVTSYCNRQVYDLCSLNDRGFAEDPSAWLLNMLTQQEVTIMLVLTPALMKAIQHIMRDPDVNALGPEPDVRDVLIYNCLRTLQNNPKHYFHRLALVRLDECVATDSKELLYFTPRCPFLLSKDEDQQNLLAALHPDPSHRPTHTASTSSTNSSSI